MDYRESEKWLKQQVAVAVDDWFVKQARNDFAEFYVWVRPGSIIVAEENPGPGYIIAPLNGKRGGNAISIAWTKDMAFVNIYGSVRKLPCLPID